MRKVFHQKVSGLQVDNLKSVVSAIRTMGLTCFIILFSGQLQADTAAGELDNHKPAFELIVLGDTGGVQDGNLSAFLLRALSEQHYVGLDAGTLVNGINIAHQNNAFCDLALVQDSQWNTSGTILRNHVKGYLISHGHLDHVVGLLISSPEDSAKPIYALPSVNQTLLDSYFNWQAWANFTDKGLPPRLNKYQLVDLIPQQSQSITDTSLKVTAFSLSHPLESTAFVIEKDKDLFVYLGDTGPDQIEKQGKLKALWQYLAEQLKEKRLRALVVEVSFTNQRPDALLFGHLTPKWLLQELTQFHSLIEDKSKIKGLQVIISHIKYTLKSGPDPKEQIEQQLNQANSLGFKFILVTQGQRLYL
ncbi:MAG: 3',5'-cyclic-nucleotide phosphodiesterase [Halioglobus sp.]|jgi:3',5'-cyclic-nucleotide phosphodiesterase